jgi:hypothetical protein
VSEAVGAVLPIQAGRNTCSGLGGAQRPRDGQDGAGATLAVNELAARLEWQRFPI